MYSRIIVLTVNSKAVTTKFRKKGLNKKKANLLK